MKQHIQNLGYEVIEPYKNIILILNFFSDDELKPIWNIINNASQSDWEKDYRESQIELAKRKYGTANIEELISRGIMEYTDDWYDKSLAISETVAYKLNDKIAQLFTFNGDLWYGNIDTIQRQYEGAELREHIDSDGDPDILYAVIGYLNDDYTGGELVFSNIGLELKPPKKSLIIFPDGKEYKHGVRAPGVGPTRYALPTFVRHISNSLGHHLK